MWKRFAEQIICIKWLVIFIWLAAAGGVFWFAPVLSDLASGDQASFLPASSEALQANRATGQLFPEQGSKSSLILVVQRENGLSAQDQAYMRKLQSYLDLNAKKYFIRQIISPADRPELQNELISQDKTVALINIGLSVPPYTEGGTNTVKDIRAIVQHGSNSSVLPAPPDGLKIKLTGDAAMSEEEQLNVDKSMDLTVKITLLLVIVILVLIYRSPLAPILPLCTIGLSFLISRGIIAVMASHGFKVSTFTETFLVAVLFGAGTDYCLLIISRFKELLAAGQNTQEALSNAMGGATAAILPSALTVIVGFVAMIFAQFGLFNTTGPSVAIGVAITLLAVMTLLPAFLAAFGTRIFWPVKVTQLKNSDGPSTWSRISGLVTSHPGRFILGTLAVFIPFIILSTGVSLSYDQLKELPSSAESVKGYKIISDKFNQGMLPVKIVLKTEQNLWDATSLQALDDVAENLLKVKNVARVRTATRPQGEKLNLTPTSASASLPSPAQSGMSSINPVSGSIPAGSFYMPPGALEQNPLLRKAMSTYIAANGKGAIMEVVLSVPPYSKEALDSVSKIKQTASLSLKNTPLAKSDIYIGGATSALSEVRDLTARDFKVVMIFVLSGIFVVLAFLLRSLVAPVYLIATILLSYAATIGISRLVFQVLLGYDGLHWAVPFFAFCVLVALGVDYNIFLMSRVKEEYRPGQTTASVARALTTTGGIITSCGIIMAGTFGAMLASPVRPIVEVGFATVAGLLIDTFIIRSLLVPALAVTIGELNWWPGRKLKIVVDE